MNRLKTNIFLLLIFIFIWIGCAGDSGSYWTDACISGDEKRIGVASMMYGAGLLDAQSGELVKKIDGPFDHIACYDNGEVVAFSSDVNVSLTSGKEEKPGSALSRDFRIGDTEFFQFTRSTKFVRPAGGDTDEKVQVNDGPPSLVIRREGEPFRQEDSIKLSAGRFEGVGEGDDSDLVVEPVKVTAGRKLLAAAGFPVNNLAHRQPASMVPGNRWGIYEIDVENDVVKRVGQMKPIDDAGILFGLANRLTMSEDEKLIAGVFDLTDGGASEKSYRSAVKVFEFPSMTEIFGAEFEDDCFADLKFSPDNSMLAVGSEQTCWNLKDEMIQVFDLEKKKLLWQNVLAERPIMLKFNRDDSLTVVTTGLAVARYNAADGTIIWNKTY